MTSVRGGEAKASKVTKPVDAGSINATVSSSSPQAMTGTKVNRIQATVRRRASSKKVPKFVGAGSKFTDRTDLSRVIDEERRARR